jgi:hypothetical protein
MANGKLRNFLIPGIEKYIYMAATGRRYAQIRQPPNSAPNQNRTSAKAMITDT